MIPLLKKLSIFFFSLYIMSLYIFQFDVNLNIISKVLFVIFIGISCGYILIKGEFVLSSAYIFFFLFGFLALISYFWAMDTDIAIERNRTLFILLIMSIIIINIIDDENSLKQCLQAIFIGGMVMCIYSLFHYGIGVTMDSFISGERLGGDINQENSFGLFCGITFILGIYNALYFKKKYYYIISVLPFTYALASGSRQSILMIAIGIGTLICFKLTKKKLINIFLAILVSVALIFIAYNLGLYYGIFERFSYFINFVLGVDGFVDNSLLVRKQMIELGIKAFLKKPILGYGTEQYNILYFNLLGRYRPSHNTYIQLLVNYGIVGFVIYYSMYYKIIKSVFTNMSNNRNISIIIFTIFVICLANHLTANQLYDKFSYIFISIGFAYINIYNNHIKNNVEDEIKK